MDTSPANTDHVPTPYEIGILNGDGSDTSNNAPPTTGPPMQAAADDAASDHESMPDLVTLDSDAPNPDLTPSATEHVDNHSTDALMTGIAVQAAVHLRFRVDDVLRNMKFDVLLGDVRALRAVIIDLVDLYRVRDVAIAGGQPITIPVDTQVLLHWFRRAVNSALGLMPNQVLDDTGIIAFALCDTAGLAVFHNKNIHRHTDISSDDLHAELLQEHADTVAAAPAALRRLIPLVDAGFDDKHLRVVYRRAQAYVTRYNPMPQISSFGERLTYDARRGDRRRERDGGYRV
ncbi:hypothetical protein DFP72DRAFT_1063462 [Ephemerocybe angulata]|uniref:Uncharacterized protein n=1 Tax=Ephemerocybe angulata TaxID=980116 RepID=A0A8H6M9A5_9AGAR|nr:hypothetical protein DFP72DRAFT_1063462 [Tulosesus angulatus]